MSQRFSIFAFSPLLAVPASGQAAPLTAAGVVADAAPPVQLIMLLLAVASVSAVVVAVLKFRQGPHLAGGSAFLSGLRMGGPILGSLGAAYTALGACLALANVPGPVPIRVLAPGFAEIMFLILMGFFAGAVAVIANWAVESRIDRAVLRA